MLPDDDRPEPEALRILRLIGVYNAVGTLRGEASYMLSKLLHRDSCALCDLTHRGLRRRADFKDATQHLPVPLELLHRDTCRPEVIAVTQGSVPCVLAETAAGLQVLLGPDELKACDGSPWALVDGLHLAARGRSLDWPGDG